MISEIKNIPLADFLSSLGHEPAVRKGTRLWYKSPLRQEQTPSFKVETMLNCWYDFGIGKGGDIIDLARLVYSSDNIGYIYRTESCGDAPHHRHGRSLCLLPRDPPHRKQEI